MPRSLCSLLLVAGVAFAAPAEVNGSNSPDDLPATGSGLAYAESCQAKLFAWRSSKTSFASEYGTTSTSTFSSDLTYVSAPDIPPTATSIITLCDGYPRVVGQWTTHNASSSTVDYRWTNTNPVFVPAAYPTPAPCSISPEDCVLLQSSWTSHWNSLTSASPGFQGGLDDPPCSTPPRPTPSYSTNSHGGQCDNCLIAGHQIRLLFWPITTVAGSGDLCNKTAVTVSDTATGPPRSVVTEGITITSPTVAVSIGGLSRVDKCGTTVDHTIIPVMPEDVSSVQGARALFTHKPFNFADLNYRCLDAPNEDFITTGTRTDCYQEVPASDYFTGYANAAGADWYNSNAFQNRTIWPNYQPQVLPPATLTQAIRSLWGPDCYIHPDGVWDPPIALEQESSFPLPKEAPGAPTSYYTPHTDAPQPGGPTTPNVPAPTQPPTAQPDRYTTSDQPSQPQPSASVSHGDGWNSGDQPSDGQGSNNGGPGGNSENDNNGGQSSGQDGGSNNSPAGGQNSGGQTDGGSGDGSSDSDGSNDGSSGSSGSQSEGSDGEGDGSSQGDNGGHRVVFTTVVTYTSAAPGDSGAQTGNGGQDEHVYTVTRIFTGEVGGQSGSASATGAVQQAGNEGAGSDGSDGSDGDSADSGSSTSGAGSGSSSGSVSSAIQSGIGGGGNNNAPEQQTNVAISITKTIGLRLSLLAVVISIFL